jgi:hypothetical protein
MAGEEGLTGGVHLLVSRKNKYISETIIVFVLNCAT